MKSAVIDGNERHWTSSPRCPLDAERSERSERQWPRSSEDSSRLIRRARGTRVICNPIDERRTPRPAAHRVTRGIYIRANTGARSAIQASVSLIPYIFTRVISQRRGARDLREHRRERKTRENYYSTLGPRDPSTKRVKPGPDSPVCTAN